MKKIVVLASGSGTNAENLIKYFAESEYARVVAIFTNNPKAGVRERAHKRNVPQFVLSPEQWDDGTFLSKLQNLQCDFIALAGFLRKVPPSILEAYPQRVVNIHPGLLPEYGGEGMYGKYVHQAVVENEEEVSGITIHYLSPEYDEGEVIFQEEVELDPDDTWEDVEYKVRQLEYKHYPEVVEYLLEAF
jgi:phosphoribosylglycinamide formyltransferase-1